MSWAAAVVLIVAIIGVSEVLKARYRARHGITTDVMGNEVPLERSDSALQREVEELRERVKVLERIATEDPAGRRLSAEIDALRDARKLEEGSKQ
jgi:hypothetical protein